MVEGYIMYLVYVLVYLLGGYGMLVWVCVWWVVVVVVGVIYGGMLIMVVVEVLFGMLLVGCIVV